MPTDKDVCNLALGKLGSYSITSLQPPKTPLEKTCAAGYRNWLHSEAKKRRWVFCTDMVQLTQVADFPNVEDGRRYKYALPTNSLRVVRLRTSEWQQRGMFLWSSQSTLTVEIIRIPLDHELPADFVDLLACRIAFEVCKPATDSTNSQQVARGWYKEALVECGRQNSFQLEPDQTTTDDYNDEWITSRWSN